MTNYIRTQCRLALIGLSRMFVWWAIRTSGLSRFWLMAALQMIAWAQRFDEEKADH